MSSLFKKDGEESSDTTNATEQVQERKDAVESKDTETGNVEEGKVTDQEEANAKESAPGEVYGKHGSQDENDPITDAEQVESLKEGAAAQSGHTFATQDSPIAEEAENRVLYSSHPVDRFAIGRFHFNAGQLSLSQEDAKEFDAILEKSPPRDRALVKKINAQQSQEQTQRTRSRRSRGIDTTSS